jgi:hypothetical protein
LEFTQYAPKNEADVTWYEIILMVAGSTGSLLAGAWGAKKLFWGKKTFDLDISTRWGFGSYGGQPGPTQILIGVGNRGKKAIEINSVGVTVNGRQDIIFRSGWTRLPVRIPPGSSKTLNVPVKKIQKTIRTQIGLSGDCEIEGWVNTGIGERFRSNDSLTMTTEELEESV